MLGTNPRFKKPRAIGEKVDNSGVVLRIDQREDLKNVFKEMDKDRIE